jgi:ribosomal protein S18 acetylase RimI-like enzyme
MLPSPTIQALIIRPYQPEDLEAVVDLWYRTWHQTFPHLQHPQPYPVWKAKFQTQLAVQGSIWVAEIDDRIVGFAAILLAEQSLDQLFVDTRYHNRGIGSALLNQAKQLCPQGLTLYTLQANTKACTFYQRHGFQRGKLSVNAFNGQPNVEYRWQP